MLSGKTTQVRPLVHHGNAASLLLLRPAVTDDILTPTSQPLYYTRASPHLQRERGCHVLEQPSQEASGRTGYHSLPEEKLAVATAGAGRPAHMQ